MLLNLRRKRVRATQHASRGPFSVLEHRNNLPFTVGIEKALRVSRDVLAAREPPQYEPTFLAVESANTIVPGGFVEHGPVEHFCTSITAMPAYEGQSFEELRLRDLTRTT